MRMRARAPALAAALALLLTGWLIAPPPAEAHAQLVSSSPGFGEVVETSPSVARLVFSEPLEPAYAGADLLDAEGRALGTDLGEPDPADARQLVVPLPALDDGTYTLSWEVVSAADGHSTQGFVSFGVGDAVLAPGVGGQAGSESDAHARHGSLQLQARVLFYGGFMLAFGLGVISAAVLRPALGGWSRAVAWLQAAALVAGVLGSVLLAIYSGEGLRGEGLASVSAYLLETRTGGLVLGRIVMAALAAVTIVVLVRLARVRGAIGVGTAAGAIAIVLTVAAGHAASFPSPAPVVSQAAHLMAAGTWLAGLGAVVVGARNARAGHLDMSAVVSRFSALAIVSIGIVGATGLAATWVQLGSLSASSLGSPYAFSLAMKLAVFAGALGLGAANYLEGGRRMATSPWPRRRVTVEALLAVVVVVLTASLASGTPPAGTQPISVQPSAATAAAGHRVELALLPARPGPNQMLVSLAVPPDGASTTLALQRLDVEQGTQQLPLSAIAAPGQFAAAGISFPAGTRWSASVILADGAGSELMRASFPFAMGVDGLAEGRATPPVDPLLVLALALLAAGVLAFVFGAAGGTLPRCEPRASRGALLVGGGTSAVLGLVLVLSGVFT